MPVIEIESSSIKKKYNSENNEEELKITMLNGYLEMNKYEELVDEFIDNVSKLTICEDLSELVLESHLNKILIDDILNGLVKTIFEGSWPPYMNEETAIQIRSNMYLKLKEKYTDIDD